MPLWINPGIKNGISVRELISTKKKKKERKKKERRQGVSMVEHSPKILASEEKATIKATITSHSGHYDER